MHNSPLPDSMGPVTPEVLLAEVRGIAATQSARFDGIEREQGTMREWMSRLSDAIDRQVTVTTKFIGLEVRQAQTEKEASDLRLEVRSLNDKVDKLQKDGIKTGIIRGAISALVGGVVSAVVIGIVLKVLGLPSAP